MVRLAIVLLLGCGLLGGGCRPTPSPSERLPGAAPVDPALARRLAAAVARHGPGDLAHTRHRRDDGTPRYTNRLILEASPYLQQHAHNPVDWYPWGEEAFARARAESKPVLLSVGYATCHWCHVMAAESFEDEEVAAYLNANYVAIKVDREERPDIDANYLTAVELMSGRGGWPMTVWLTPARDPFFGGTYFPARDGERGVRTGFLTRLRQLREAFDTTPAAVGEQAGTLAARVRALAAPAAGTTLPDATVLHAAFGAYAASFDAVHGGFGRAPKFPMPVALDFLLRYHRRTRTPAALTMVTRTLEAMAAGGVHDQLGGGFHRYATDPAWQVPHFEKMLYDNAQLALVYLAAFQVTGRDDFRRVVRTTLDYLERDLSAPGGGFYAASDADSDGGEGRFFVWTPAEVAAVLPPAPAAAVSAYYGVTPGGNFDGHTILHVGRPLEAVAADLGTPPEELAALVEAARPRLLAARAARVPPAVDTKVLTAWNGLAISAFARAGAVLGSTADIERARRAAAFALDHLRPGGRLKRSFADGAAHEDAFLDDYAMLAAGLFDLYEATFELRWLRAALTLHAELARDFADDAGGGFFTTGAGREVVLARAKPLDDGALPSGNAVAAETLLGLAELTGDDRPRARADGVFRALAPLLARAPTAAARALAALERRLDRTKEVVLVAPRPGDPGLAALLTIVRAAYLPNHVLTAASEGPALAAQQELIPLVGDKRALRGLATAYVCEAGTCAAPTTDAIMLAAQLATVQPLADAAGAETP